MCSRNVTAAFCSTLDVFSTAIFRFGRDSGRKVHVWERVPQNVMRTGSALAAEEPAFFEIPDGRSSARHLFHFRKRRQRHARAEFTALLDQAVQPAIEEKNRALARFAIAAVGFAR